MVFDGFALGVFDGFVFRMLAVAMMLRAMLFARARLIRGAAFADADELPTSCTGDS